MQTFVNWLSQHPLTAIVTITAIIAIAIVIINRKTLFRQ